MLDGQVARLGGMASTFGAMYDSVLDRYCEMFTLGGIAAYLAERRHVGEYRYDAHCHVEDDVGVEIREGGEAQAAYAAGEQASQTTLW